MIMKAVIFAAGKSTRTYPLTVTRPKVLLKLANKPIIQYNLDNLRGLVDEVIMIVGYRKEMIREAFGDDYKGMKIKYVEQENQLGTAHALATAEPHLGKGRFLVVMGDDVYYRENMKRLLDYELSLLVQKVKVPQRFGVWVIEDGFVKGFAEKPERFVSDMANCGLYVLDERVFPYIKKLEKSVRGEYELNEAVNELAKKAGVKAVEANKGWLSVGYPWDIIDSNRRILEEITEPSIRGEVEEGATIKGNVIIGEGTLIRSGSYIDGPVVIGKNCDIGPNCFIRPFTTIGDNSRIGNAVEIKNSVLMGKVRIGHLSYFGDSVLGFDINIGAGTIIANLRHDNREIETYIKGEITPTYRRKFGTVMGDGVHTGINTSIYPGRKIWPHKTTLPGEVVERDVA